MKKLLQELGAVLGRQEACVLATVGSQSGSTPRVAGARMLVRVDGSIHGTIGGGMVEAEAIVQQLNAVSTSRACTVILICQMMQLR